MPADIGGTGWVAVCFETVMGTYASPAIGPTFWIPVLSESLAYTEEAYFSPQIRQKTAVSQRTQGYYHVEGDIVLDGNATDLIPFMYASRHLITKNANVGTIATTGDTHSSTLVDNIPDTTGILVGSGVSGAGIPGGTTVASLTATSVTLSAAATATATGVALTFTGTQPNEYIFTSGVIGTATTDVGATTRKTLSITVHRDGANFGYVGCVINTIQIEIDDAGIERWTLGVVGLGEIQGVNATAAWAAPLTHPPQSHNFFWGAGMPSPTYPNQELGFNNFTWNVNTNATPQNRIVSDRKAQYIAYGENEVTFNGTIDFVDRVKYENLKNNDFLALLFRGFEGGVTLYTQAMKTAWQVGMPGVYIDTYELGIGALGDLITADMTGRAVSQHGGSQYALRFRAPLDIT